MRRRRRCDRPQASAPADRHSAPSSKRTPFGFENRADAIGHILVLARQQARGTLDNGHRSAQPAHQVGELQADVAAADDHQVLGHRVQFHHRDVVECLHGVDARQRGAHGAATDVEEDARRAQAAPAHVQRGRTDKAGIADDDLGALQVHASRFRRPRATSRRSRPCAPSRGPCPRADPPRRSRTRRRAAQAGRRVRWPPASWSARSPR